MSNWFKGFFKNKRAIAVQFLLILGILIVSNILAEELVWRLDMTAGNRYTLSAASEKIAASLEDPVTVTAYFSEDMPPQLEQVKSQFQNFLEEFRARSGDNLEYEFINPNEGDEAEREARQAGIRPLMIDVRERDQISQQRAYMGAVFHYRNKQEAVPVVRPGSGLEYTIASTIKQLTVEQKPKVGLLSGHGEAGRQEMIQLTRELSQRYQLVNVSGLDTTDVPADIEVLMVIAPTQKLSQQELISIDQYIMSGGKAIFALNRVQTQVQRGMARPLETGVEQLLSSYGVPVKPNLVRDVNASSIQVQQRQGGFTMVNQIQYPYIPQISNFGDHPISKGLETVIFRFVSSIDTAQADSTHNLTVLAQSSDQAGISERRFNLSPMNNWSRRDFPRSHIPLAASVEGTFKSAFANNDSVKVPLPQSRKTAMVVFGDGDFLVNGAGQRQQRLPEDNISLAVNSVDWLADDTGLIALRTQGVTNRPLQTVEGATKTVLKYFNLFFPLLLVLGYGLYRYQRKKARRRMWIEEGI